MTTTYTPPTYTTEEQLRRALQVLTRTAHVVAYLQAHDPKALQQARAALGERCCPYCGNASPQGYVTCAASACQEAYYVDAHTCRSMSGERRCDRPRGHAGAHGCALGALHGQPATGERCSWRGR